jgi:hypothetical protein
MSNTDHPKDNPHKLQKVLNDRLERGAVAVTIKIGESIELSNGTTLIFKKKKATASNAICVVIVAPRETRVYRQSYSEKKPDGETS